MSSQSLTSEQARRIRRKQERRDPRMWIRYNWQHPNDPRRNYDFRTNDGDPLHYLADDRGPLNPEQWGSINILMMARGCLKTTTVLGITQWACDTIPQFESFMTAPSDKQVTEFTGKFQDSVLDTPLEQKREKDNKHHQKFQSILKREDGQSVTVHSHMKAQSAWDADEGMRGPHSHVGIIDEFQDVDREAFEVFIEIIDQSIPGYSYFPCMFLIGTPKLKNTFFHEMWMKSNQRIWDADVDAPTDVERDSGAWIDEAEVGEYAPEGYEGDPFTVRGWKIDQYNSPLHDEATIEFKRQNNSEKKFQNESLANFYTPEDDFLREEDIKAAFYVNHGEDPRPFRNTRMYPDNEVILTADWGGGEGEDASDTVIVVGEKEIIPANEDGNDVESYRHHVLNFRFLDHDISKTDELDVVRKWMGKYDVDQALVDEGHAGARRETLQDEFGVERVTGCWYGNVKPAEDVKWRTDDQDRKVFCTVDKTYCAESMVDSFRDGKWRIPSKDLHFGTKRENGSKLLRQLTATYKEYKSTPSGSKRLRVQSDRNDDAFDAFTYQWIALEHLGPVADLSEFVLTDMRGY